MTPVNVDYTPVDGPVSLSIWSAQTDLGRLLKNQNQKGNRCGKGWDGDGVSRKRYKILKY